MTAKAEAEARSEVRSGRWRRRERLPLLSIVLVAVAVRAIAFLQLSSTSAFDLHRWAQSDMHFFDRWAHAIADGDVLSRDVGHPLHEWHVEVAQRVLAVHPELAQPQAALADNARRLWDGWYGPRRLHQEPLYPYLLAAVVGAGGGVPAVFALQATLGVAIVLLVGAIARRRGPPCAVRWSSSRRCCFARRS